MKVKAWSCGHAVSGGESTVVPCQDSAILVRVLPIKYDKLVVCLKYTRYSTCLIKKQDQQFNGSMCEGVPPAATSTVTLEYLSSACRA